jgi:hypothetical protein
MTAPAVDLTAAVLGAALAEFGEITFRAADLDGHLAVFDRRDNIMYLDPTDQDQHELLGFAVDHLARMVAERATERAGDWLLVDDGRPETA